MPDLPAGPPLVIPVLGRLYAWLTPLAETLLRIVAGGMLMMHGWPKITNPLGAMGMVERLGFHPPWLWSLLLSLTEFGGGALLVLGLFTRLAAAATTIQLLVVVYAHWVVQGQGYRGSEFPIMWAAVLFFLALRGSNNFSLDARIIGRQI